MVQGFTKEVFKSKEAVMLFLSSLSNCNLSQDVLKSLSLLSYINYKDYYVQLENLIDELQVIIINSSDSTHIVTSVFRKDYYHKFYISNCKFISTDFRNHNVSTIFGMMLKGKYIKRIFFKSRKVFQEEVLFLNVLRKVKIGLFNFFRKPDNIFEAEGVNVFLTIPPHLVFYGKNK